MKKPFLLIFFAMFLSLTAGAVGEGGEYHIARGNNIRFGKLLAQLEKACDHPSAKDEAVITSLLADIRDRNETDGEVADAITDHWRTVFLKQNGEYPLYVHHGEERAEELEASGLLPGNGQAHAFVVLGFQLVKGEMTQELKSRCEAAAAAARSWPDAILVCSGGATGSANPKKHTEAGLMKQYLTEVCGIDACRIYTDEQARTTRENAVNTFAILREKQIASYTLVTSGYHQCWSQVLYHAMGEICRHSEGAYTATLIGNYCADVTPSRRSYLRGDRFAIYQLGQLLKLPDSAMELLDNPF